MSQGLGLSRATRLADSANIHADFCIYDTPPATGAFEMVTYPIHVKRDAYRGANPKQQFKARETNRIAFEIETYINRQLKAQTDAVKNCSYYEIATETGHSVTVVRDLCFQIDCGHHGFTAIRHGMSYQDAIASL